MRKFILNNGKTGDGGMKMSKTQAPYLKGLLLFLVVFLLPVTAMAEAPSPWQWQLSLRIEKAGDSMYMPSAVVFDKEGERYYVVDTGLNRLVSFGKDGALQKVFTANDQLKSPFDMVRLDNGQLLVVEKGRNSLTRIDVAAKKVTPNTLKDGPRLVFPDRIAAAAGKFYVLDRASGQVLRLDANLAVEQHFGCPDCTAGLVDFVIDKDSVLALEPRDKKIYRFKADGTVENTISLSGELDFPVSLAAGQGGVIFVLDRHKNSVLAFSESGQYLYRFLDTGQSAGKVYFARQIRFDPWGRLCVVDEGNGRVEIYSQ